MSNTLPQRSLKFLLLQMYFSFCSRGDLTWIEIRGKLTEPTFICGFHSLLWAQLMQQLLLVNIFSLNFSTYTHCGLGAIANPSFFRVELNPGWREQDNTTENTDGSHQPSSILINNSTIAGKSFLWWHHYFFNSKKSLVLLLKFSPQLSACAL